MLLHKYIVFFKVFCQNCALFSLKYGTIGQILGPYSQKSWHATLFTNKLFFIGSGMPLFSRIRPLYDVSIFFLLFDNNQGDILLISIQWIQNNKVFNTTFTDKDI
jgi:hypothetical protein